MEGRDVIEWGRHGNGEAQEDDLTVVTQTLKLRDCLAVSQTVFRHSWAMDDMRQSCV